MAHPDIQINEVGALSAINLVANLHNVGETKLKNEGSIRVGSRTYKVTYVQNQDGTEKLQMKRHYTGFLIGPLLNKLKKSTLTTQSTALALNDKIADLMKSTNYQLARNTYDKLMDIANTHTGDANGVIEVANYGHSEPRNKIESLGVVEAVNRTLAKSGKSIRLNKIDTYNTELGITNETLMPDQYGATMKKIASGTLTVNEKMLDNERYTVEREDLEKWRTYISKPEIAEKIDIPKKLHAYLNQPEGASAEDANLVGWKKDFKMNPDQALRNFVIKNLPSSALKDGGASEESIAFQCDRIKEYVAIYNMEDGAEKDEKMKAFLKYENWPHTKVDENNLKNMIAPLIKAKAQEANMPIREAWKRFGKEIRDNFIKNNPQEALKCSASYRTFANISMYATFRQTSKLGLDFFKSQNTPILFHMSHRNLTDFGDIDWIKGENHWKSGQIDPTYAGSEITHSEVRHANKLVEQYGGEGTDGADLWFVKGVQVNNP